MRSFSAWTADVRDMLAEQEEAVKTLRTPYATCYDELYQSDFSKLEARVGAERKVVEIKKKMLQNIQMSTSPDPLGLKEAYLIQQQWRKENGVP